MSSWRKTKMRAKPFEFRGVRSEDLAIPTRSYKYVPISTRTSTTVIPSPGKKVEPAVRHERLYGDRGRRAPMTKPYRPLGTPDHSLRDRSPLSLRRGREETAANLAARRRRLKQAVGNKSMFDVMRAKAQQGSRKVTSSKSLDSLRKYRRTGNKRSGIQQLRDRIIESRNRMKSVKAGHGMKTQELAEAATVSSRTGLEAKWQREAEVAELLLRQRRGSDSDEETGHDPAADEIAVQQGMALLRKNLGRHYLPYHQRRPKTPYLMAPTVTQASVEASGSRTDIHQHKKRQRANFNKLVNNFGRAGKPRPVAMFQHELGIVDTPPQQSPAVLIERRCADYKASQKLLTQGLGEMLDHLDHERLVMLQRKQQALDYAVANQLSNARRVLPAIRFAAELERSREQLNSVAQAEWYGQLMLEVLSRTKLRLINEEVEEEKLAGRSVQDMAPPQIDPLTLAKSILPSVRFMLARVRELTLLGRVMDKRAFVHMLRELRTKELQSATAVFCVVFIARNLGLRDEDMQRCLRKANLPRISFVEEEEAASAAGKEGESKGYTGARGAPFGTRGDAIMKRGEHKVPTV